MEGMKDLDWEIPKAAMMMTHGLAKVFTGWQEITNRTDTPESASPKSTLPND